MRVLLRRLGRPLATGVTLCAAAGLLVWAAAAPWRAVRAGTAGFEELLVVAVASAAGLALGYVVAVLVLTALGALPGIAGRVGTSLADRVTPAGLRGLARASVGVGLAAGSLAAGVPAHAGPLAAGGPPAVVSEAAPTGPPASDLPAVTRPQSPDPLAAVEVTALGAVGRPGGGPPWTPAVTSPPAETMPPAAATDAGLVRPAPRDAEPIAGEVVVRRGDTLWELSARALGPDATHAEVAADWPAWYAANRHVIGDDPHLLLPGTVLRPPARP